MYGRCPAPPPPTQLFRVRVCSFPPFESIPPISGLPTFLNPPFAGFSLASPALETPPKKKIKKSGTLLNVPPPPSQFQVSSSRSRGTGGQCFYFSKWNNPKWAFKASRNFRNLILGFDQFFYDIQDILKNPFYISQESKEREKKKKHPLFKEISGWKVKYPPFFLQFSGRILSREKVPLSWRF